MVENASPTPLLSLPLSFHLASLSASLNNQSQRKLRSGSAAHLRCLAELVGILGWREQVMAFWSALIYTPPFLCLSTVKRWER